MLKKLYRTIRLFPKRGREPYVSFYKILNFYPYNIMLYEQALLHKSSSIKLKDGRWINNERLEFLGDAILDAIVADIVFKEFEYKKEGFLTNMRSKIVQRETLNKLALNLGLDRLIKSSAKTGNHKTHMYGNALEALIGAIYLDQGYRIAKKFVHERLIVEHLNIETVAQQEVNFKSRLIEWSQKNKIPVEFRLIESFTDDNNNPIFYTAVDIYDFESGTGRGYSKKESQQRAAEEALDKINMDKEFLKEILILKEKESELPALEESPEENPSTDFTTNNETEKA
ncbi:ribonuclease-3 [Dysgonomonas alginatilytica]|uniref:Ribonuclease 3 n=1 Tax=Dysgonomonas alginatilytica TaxID=1605892 RepID=A0A2V3PRN8_9BACT|nr:ribonuclease III [Dysgonomonas alginatilytica]PXV67359.1 ribonuclease-3 [Dysgonomonas alginatilytica]